MITKYGKKYGSVASLKEDFCTKNDEHLGENNRIALIYSEQPKRTFCKVCEKELVGHRFYSHGLSYTICERCGHVNGEYLETADFSMRVYEELDYGYNYREEDRAGYEKRMDTIYVPKAEFLCNVLKNEDAQKQAEVLDVGAGSGYFVGALVKRGINAKGVEISSRQVEFGNRMLGEQLLYCTSSDGVVNEIRDTKANVISFIGVLEHVVNLWEVLNAVNENSSIEYVFFSVPMFSYSVIIEALNPNVFNRLLGGTHTHIFSDESLKYLYNRLKWQVVGEWRFGTDVADFIRATSVNLNKSNNELLCGLFNEKFCNVLDDIQMVLDKSHFCSEIHVLAKKACVSN